jgi:uncharacterized protein (DUF302 family)
MNSPPISGLISIPSHYSVDETVSRLKALLASKGIKLFAIIDHSGEAATVGLSMPPTRLLLFGDPHAGTPLMLASPSIAIDLPLKLLVAQADDGPVTVSYNAPAYLGERHHIPEDILRNIAGIEALAHKIAD